MAKFEKSKPVYVDPLTSEVVIDAGADAANWDWIRAARLHKAADAGDQEAARKLREPYETPTVREVPD